MEVLVAGVILTLILTALLRLDLISSVQAARNYLELRSLPIASEALEEALRTRFHGEETRSYQGEFDVRLWTGEVPSQPEIEKLAVSVQREGKTYAELLTYRLRLP